MDVFGPDPTGMDMSEEGDKLREKVEGIVDELDAVDSAALNIMLHFRCHGMVENGSGASSKLETALKEKFLGDYEAIMSNLFGRAR